jgi:hypothetical protein
MKKFLYMAGLAGVMAAPNLYAAFDGTITLTQGAYSYGNGGEFKAVTSQPSLGTFQTFCLEYNQEFAPGAQYSYFQNTGAVSGDGNLGTPHTDPHTGLPMDNLSVGTAWLYSQFRAGTLTRDTGTGSYFDANRLNNAGELQQAIWFLEDETGGVNNGYVGLAETALSETLSQIKADSLGAYGVIALNLYSTVQVGNNPPVVINGTTYYQSQDQLAIVPETTTVIAGLLLLLPLGASTLRILRKNRMA